MVAPRASNAKKLGVLGLASIVFYSVAGTPAGAEYVVVGGGPLLTLIGFLIMPLVWSIPEALVSIGVHTMVLIRFWLTQSHAWDHLCVSKGKIFTCTNTHKHIPAHVHTCTSPHTLTETTTTTLVPPPSSSSPNKNLRDGNR